MTRATQTSGLRSISAVAGLRRRGLPFPKALGQSIAAAAPSAGMASVPIIVLAQSGANPMVSCAAATVLVLLIAYCLGQFAKRMAATGGVYSYAARSLGGTAGLITGWFVVLGYASICIASLFGIVRFVEEAMTGLGVSVGWGAVGAVLLVVAVATGAAALIMREIKFSAGVLLVVEVISIAVISALVLLVALRTPPENFTSALTLGAVDPASLTYGTVLAAAAFVGFESSTTLGAEVRSTFRTIPRTLVWTPIVVGFLLVSSSLSSGLYLASNSSATSPALLDAIAVVGPTGLSVALHLGVALSFFGCVLASGTALTRVLFTLGREGILPVALGHARSSSGVPATAVVTAMSVITATTVVAMTAGLSPNTGLTVFLTIATLGYLCSYLAIAVATPLFLRRIGEVTWPPAAAAVITAVALGYLLVQTLWTESSGGSFSAVLGFLFLAGFGIVAAGCLRVFAPTRLSGAGLYDEVTLADLMPGTTGMRG